MLAKQAWRLLTNPQSLLPCLYKAKYYPNSSILDAEIGQAPSFSWRSIMQGIPVLKAGIQWKIGTGEMVNIWQDKWIPISPPPNIIRPQHIEFEQVADH